MVTYTWTGSDDGTSFADAGNWSPTGIPGLSDVADFTGTLVSEMVNGNSTTIGELIVSSGNTLTLAGDLTTEGVSNSSQSVMIDGTLIVAAGTTLTSTNTNSYFDIGYADPGSMTVNGTVESYYLAVGENGSSGTQGASNLTVSGLNATVDAYQIYGLPEATISVVNQGSLTASSVLYLPGGTLQIDDTASLSAGLILLDHGTIEAVADGSSSTSQVVTLSTPLQIAGGSTADFGSDGQSVLNITGSISEGSPSSSPGMVINAGTADLGQASFSDIASLTVHSGATLQFSSPDPSSGTTQTLDGISSFTNNGVVSVLDGMDLAFSSGTTVTNLLGGTLTGGIWAVENYGDGGTIDLNGSAIETLAANVKLGGSFGNPVFETTDNSGSSPVTTQLQNSLTTIASGGTLQILGFLNEFDSTTSGLEVQNGGKIAMLGLTGLSQSGTGVTLDSGGRLVGNGYVDDAVTAKAGSTITTIAAYSLIFNGTGNTLAGTLNGFGTVEFSGGSSTIQAGAKLLAYGLDLESTTVALGGSFSYGRDLTVFSSELDFGGHALSLAGELNLDDASITGAGTLRLGFAASVTNDASSTIQPNLQTNATFANSGTLDIAGRVNGTGTFTQGTDTTTSSLEFGSSVAAGQTIDFFGNRNGSLLLDKANQFKGTVANFVAGDTIDLTNVADKGLHLSYMPGSTAGSGTLDVIYGKSLVEASIALTGVNGTNFQLGSDGQHGTSITLAGPSVS